MSATLDCQCGKRCEGTTGKCASCNRLERKAAAIKPSDNNGPIEKRSTKGKEVDRKYLADLRVWKRGRKCEATFPHECDGTLTAHHKHGRSDNAFFDEWAEQNGIVLTLDKRWWFPCCLTAHRYITDHPKFAHENGYSYLRLAEVVELTREDHERITKLRKQTTHVHSHNVDANMFPIYQTAVKKELPPQLNKKVRRIFGMRLRCLSIPILFRHRN